MAPGSFSINARLCRLFKCIIVMSQQYIDLYVLRQGVRTEILFLDVIAIKFTRNYFYVLKVLFLKIC